MRDVEIVGVSPDELGPLFRALTECGRRYCRIRNPRVLAQAIGRLTEPPKSLQMPTPGRTELANSLLTAVVPCDGDTAAYMLRLDEEMLDSDAKWSALSRAERKRAKRLWCWALDTSLDISPQGRPHKIDPALVLYCARVIAEGCGKPHLTISRSYEGSPPRGPMWRALIAALPLAQTFLASGCMQVHGAQEARVHAETIADILKTARSERFKARCQDLGLSTSANDVADRPGSFRYALARARALRSHRAKK
jgi:hypothetical protein